MLPEPVPARPIDVVLLLHAKVVPVVVLLNVNALWIVPLQSAWFPGTITLGVGFTVIVRFCDIPIHPFAVGLTVIVAVIGAAVLFVAVKAAILPAPVPASPIDIVLLLHAKVVPVVVLLNVNALWVAPLQSVWLPGTITLGVGFTVIVKFCDVPTQPLAVGVTVIVAVTGELPLLAAVNEAMVLPVPLPARPMDVVLFDQL
jgi:hypothetical protein